MQQWVRMVNCRFKPNQEVGWLLILVHFVKLLFRHEDSQIHCHIAERYAKIPSGVVPMLKGMNLMSDCKYKWDMFDWKLSVIGIINFYEWNTDFFFIDTQSCQNITVIFILPGILSLKAPVLSCECLVTFSHAAILSLHSSSSSLMMLWYQGRDDDMTAYPNNRLSEWQVTVTKGKCPQVLQQTW